MFRCMVYGFPIDVKDRELHNLAWQIQGCVRSTLEPCNGGRIGILEFASVEAAQQAAMKLHNHPFDPTYRQYLTTQFVQPMFFGRPDVFVPMGRRGVANRGEDWRQSVVPAHEKRKIIIKNLDLTTRVVSPCRSNKRRLLQRKDCKNLSRQ